MNKYVGTFKKIYAVRENWASGLFVTEDGTSYNASGNILNPITNIEYEIEGNEYIDAKWGLQLKVETCFINMQGTSNEFILSFLSSGLVKGIGEALAKRIVDKFGNKTLDIIEHKKEKLLEVRGISDKKANIIYESYMQSKVFSKLFEITKGKITPNLASKIIEVYQSKSVSIIKENPYDLIYKIDGVGFNKADAIASAVGIEKTSIHRVQAAIVYILKQMSELQGHCYLDIETLQKETLYLVNPFEIEILSKKETSHIKEYIYQNLNNIDYNKLDQLTDEEKIYIKKWIDRSLLFIDLMADAILKDIEDELLHMDEDRVYWMKLYKKEVYLGKTIAKLIKQKPIFQLEISEIQNQIDEHERKTGIQLAPQQKEAIIMALTKRLSVITGGPGRGKTTIINLIASIWGNDENLILCAPTGKAAQRMRDTSGKDAKTVHRTIYDFSNWENPNSILSVENKLIIVDESSMLDLCLAGDILKFAENSQIVFVGDINQLPSVGAGSFLKDLVECPHVATTMLKKGFRNAGSIADNCDLINDGKSSKNFILDEDFVFEEITRENLLNKIVDTYVDIYKKYGANSVWILSPMKVNALGSNNINLKIREIVNQTTSKKELEGFKENDRVMVIKNNYKIVTYKDGEKSLGIFNGDCGIITKIDDEEGTFSVLFDDGRFAEIEKIKISLFQLAYAITIHKSQGSECDYTIIPMDFSYYIMLKRNLLYTAVSRTKKKTILLGDKKAVDMAIRTVPDETRNSYLKNRIILNI